MNPAIDHALIDEAYERDPASAAAEYGEDRSDAERRTMRGGRVNIDHAPGAHDGIAITWPAL